MTSKNVLIAIIVLVILGGGVLYLSPTNDNQEEAMYGDESSSLMGSDSLTNNESNTGTQTSGEDRMQNMMDNGKADGAVVIRRTATGFEPSTVTIHQGETVTFINDSAKPDWPASNVHPTHQIYSEFDPKRPLAPGESWPFTFTKVGEWKFHDHLQANVTGLIVVTP